MIKYYFIILIFFLSSCKIKSTQSANEDLEIQKIIAIFFEKYKANNTSEAIDFLFDSNSNINKSQIQNLKDKLSSAGLLAGKFNGYEQITTQKASPSLIYYSFLVKHDIQPIRFNFMFYKPKDKWEIYKFKFDDQVDKELEESGKVYFLK